MIANMPMREKTKVDARLSCNSLYAPTFVLSLRSRRPGPWKEWKDDANGIPLGLYSRQSLAKDVDAAEVSLPGVTKKGASFSPSSLAIPTLIQSTIRF